MLITSQGFDKNQPRNIEMIKFIKVPIMHIYNTTYIIRHVQDLEAINVLIKCEKAPWKSKHLLWKMTTSSGDNITLKLSGLWDKYWNTFIWLSLLFPGWHLNNLKQGWQQNVDFDIFRIQGNHKSVKFSWCKIYWNILLMFTVQVFIFLMIFPLQFKLKENSILFWSNFF